MYKLIPLLILLVCSRGYSQNKYFTITAKLEQFKDSTKLFLTDNGTEKLIDSALLYKGSLILKGNYPKGSSYCRVTLHTKDYSSYKMLWLDGSKTYFTASKDNFRNGKVTGSKAQAVMDKYQLLVEPYYQNISTLAKTQKGKQGKDSTMITDSIIALESSIDSIAFEFIQKNPSSIISASILSTMSSRIGVAKSKKLFALFPESIKNSSYGQNIKKSITLNREPKVGDQFVDFTQRGADGKMVKVYDLKYEYLLLEFWFSWCAPCIRENPGLVKMYNEYHPKGFEILGVSVDKSEQVWRKAIQRDSLPWINVCELTGTDNTAVLMYGVYEYPTNYLINKQGKIIAKNLRGEILRNKLKELLK